MKRRSTSGKEERYDIDPFPPASGFIRNTRNNLAHNSRVIDRSCVESSAIAPQREVHFKGVSFHDKKRYRSDIDSRMRALLAPLAVHGLSVDFLDCVGPTFDPIWPEFSLALRAAALVERFDIEPFSDFSAK